MPQNLLDIATQLRLAGEPYVLATVVWCERPTSAKPGAQALIDQHGELKGWIGGSCAQPTVIREAQRVLREGGEPYLLRLGSPAPELGMDRDAVRVFPMTCTSGGVLDIFMEPHFPQPRLLLIGASPILATLSLLASTVDFAVMQIDDPDLKELAIDGRSYVVVATHGQYDEPALERVLTAPAAYVGLVASPRRAESVRDYLRGSGLSEEQLARLKAPAGLDIGAVSPEEIAASILAELVQVKRQPTSKPAASKLTEDRSEMPVESLVSSREEIGSALSETAIDPVCEMVVEIASARHHLTYDGREFYFCCPACKRLFERNPQEYLAHQH